MRGLSYLLLMTALLLLIVTALLRPLTTSNAAPQEIFGVCVSQVPADWGPFRGGSEQTGLAFEDRHGTLRFITGFPCNSAVPPVALEVRRTPGNP